MYTSAEVREILGGSFAIFDNVLGMFWTSNENHGGAEGMLTTGKMVDFPSEGHKLGNGSMEETRHASIDPLTPSWPVRTARNLSQLRCALVTRCGCTNAR